MSFRRKFSCIPRAGVPLKNPACLELARSAALGIFFFSQTLPPPINLINDLALVYIYVCVPVYPRAAALYISISLPLPSSLALIADVQAKIAGAGEVFVRKGSTISLTCTVNSQGVPPSNVTWYHAGTIIDFDGPRLVHIHTYIYIYSYAVGISRPIERACKCSGWRRRGERWLSRAARAALWASNANRYGNSFRLPGDNFEFAEGDSNARCGTGKLRRKRLTKLPILESAMRQLGMVLQISMKRLWEF